MFSFFHLIRVSGIVFALLFSLSPSRNSDPGSDSRVFSPIPVTVHALYFYRERDFSPLFPSSTRVEMLFCCISFSRAHVVCQQLAACYVAQHILAGGGVPSCFVGDVLGDRGRCYFIPQYIVQETPASPPFSWSLLPPYCSLPDVRFDRVQAL